MSPGDVTHPESDSLAARLAPGALPVHEALALAVAMAEALRAAHARGLAHGDLDPARVIVTGEGGVRIELGAGHAPRDARAGDAFVPGARLLSGGVGGRSPLTLARATMAPEQARGEEADPRSDVFALGALIHHCLTGTPAFTGDDPGALLAKIVLDEVPRAGARRPGVPAALDDLLARMLDKDPARRPRDAGAVASELAAMVALEGDPPTAPEGLPAGRTRPSTRPELGPAERRVVGVVLVGAAASGSHDAASPVPLEVLRAAVEARHGRLWALADGSLSALLAGAGLAEDRAGIAAECAAALRTVLPTRTMALAVGRGDAGGDRPIGEAIDRAAKLLRALGRLPEEARAAAGIAVDEVAAGLLERRFDLGEGPAGRELRAGRPPLDSPRTLLGRPTACVGRDRELGALADIFEESCSTPVARAALVTAPPGFGKSRLAHELLERLYGQAEIWIGRGDPVSAGSAFSLLSAAIKHTAGVKDGDPLPLRREKLRARVARNLPAGPGARVAAFLGELVGAPFPDDAAPDLAAARGDAARMGDLVRRAWVDFVRAECAWSNVVLLLDDLHWGDLPTLQLVGAALAALPGRPFLVLGLGRPEVHDRFPGLWAEHHVTELRLGALSPEASARLVAEALGDGVDAARAAWLVEQADGHPLYLEELIRAAARGHDQTVTETAQAMVESRLARLDPEARRALRAASVFGETFWTGGVTALFGQGSELPRRLAELCGEELLLRRAVARFAGERELSFSHGLVREAVYATLTDEDRRLGHLLAGAWLERAGETDSMVLAGHYEAGGDRERAARWYLRATAQAFEGNDLDAVLRRSAAGVACAGEAGPGGADAGARGPLSLFQAQAHRWRGDLPAAERHGREAMSRLLPRSALWFHAAREVILASTGERLEAAVGEVRAAAREESVAAAQLGALSAAHARLLAEGRRDLAAEILPSIEGLASAPAARGAEPRRDGAAAAALHGARARHAFSTGDAAAYLRNAEAACSAWERAGDLRSSAALRMEMGRVWALVGAYDQAEHALRAALPEAARMGLAALIVEGRHQLGLTLARVGRLEEARALLEAVLEALTLGTTDAGAAARRNQAAAQADLATTLLLLAEDDGPERHARAALALFDEEGRTPGQPASSLPADQPRAAALATLAEILLADRLADGALTCARAALALVPAADGGTPLDSVEGRVRLVHVEALAATLDHAGARTALGDARLRLLARAAALGDSNLRRTFLEGVPEHARTLDLARLAGIPALRAPPPSTARRPSLPASPESEIAAAQREARQALARGNADAAITHVERAMNHAAPGEVRAELRALMARAHGLRNAWVSAGRWAEQGLSEAAPGSPGWYAALCPRMLAAAQLGEGDPIVSAADALPRIVVASGAGAAVVPALAALGMALAPLGEAARLQDCFDRMDRVGAPLAARDPAARGWMSRARAQRARVMEEDPWTALRLDEAARAAFTEAGEGAEAALSLVHVGIDRWQLGAHERAEEAFRAALETAGPRGHLASLAGVHLAWTMADAGRLGEADDALAASVKAEPSRYNPEARAAAGAVRADILRRLGELDAAEAEALTVLTSRDLSPLARTATLATQAAVLLQRGRAAEALELCRRARAERETLRVSGFRDAFVRLVHIDALLATGGVAAARTPISRAYARLLVHSSKIGDPALRSSFLERVPEHVRTLALAQKWLGDVSDHAFR